MIIKLGFPRITIVTPSLNQGKFIGQTIDSVLNQNYPNLEYIVIDGGSTDDTTNVLRSYGDRLQWVSEKDAGQADAINRGFFKSDGEILGFLNSDDCYSPGCLHQVAQQFSQSGCQWLTGDYRIVNENNKEIQKYIVSYKKFWRMFSSERILSIINYISQPSTFFTRRFWEKMGPFDDQLQYTFDYDLWLRAIRLEFPLILPQSLSCFRVHKQAKGSSQYKKQFSEEMLVLRKHNQNKLVQLIHQAHNYLITLAYGLIK